MVTVGSESETSLTKKKTNNSYNNNDNNNKMTSKDVVRPVANEVA